MSKTRYTSHMDFLIHTEKNHLLPTPLGLVRRNGSETVLDIRNYSIGDEYAGALGKSLSKLPKLDCLNLKGNRMTEKGSVSILSNIQGKPVKRLDLSDNKIGQKSVSLVTQSLTNRQNRLKHLSLENTGLFDFQLIELCQAIVDSPFITSINLSRNKISKSQPFWEILATSDCLKKLDLHWNSMQDVANLFEVIGDNGSLLELDLSWNTLSKGNNWNAISQALRDNTRLWHLDLSHNNLTQIQWTTISEGLSHNHTILGIHMLGNECTVDSKGFVLPRTRPQTISKSHIYSRSLSNMLGTKRNFSNCWICDQWVEVTFKWKPVEEQRHPIYLHLSCDDYAFELMHLNTRGYFIATRAVPKTGVYWFFSHAGKMLLTDKVRTLPLEEPKQVSVEFWTGNTVIFDVTEVNFKRFFGPNCSVKESFEEAYPRIPTEVYVPEEIARAKTPWSIPISLFKDYKFDSDIIFNKCFEFDWSWAKLTKVIKNPETLAEFKEVMRKGYKKIRHCYKYFAAIGSGGGIFSVGQNAFTDFCSSSGVINNTTFKLADVDFNLKATLYSESKNNPLNPGNALVRFEFMEILGRVALDKWFKTGEWKTQPEALRKQLQDMKPFMRTINSNKWRWKNYICEEVDSVLKSYLQILKRVYRQFSGRFTKPGKPKFMSLDEFQDLCSSAGIVNQDFAAREMGVCFNLAMMTQVDEISKRRHIEMQFVEFLEAISRAANEANLPINVPDAKTFSESIIDVKNKPLSVKIESIMPHLLALLPRGTQDSFQYPDSSPYSGLNRSPEKRGGYSSNIGSDTLRDLKIVQEEKSAEKYGEINFPE